MTYKTVLGAAASVMTLVGYAPYLRNTLAGRTRPHALSWLVWCSITAIAFAGQLVEKAGPGSSVTGVSGAGPGVYPRRAVDHPGRAHRRAGSVHRTRPVHPDPDSPSRTYRVLISYRYNTVRDADHIYVLDRGRVKHGNHNDLMNAAGVYAELFTLQAAAYTDRPSPNGHRKATDKPLATPHQKAQ
jgi:hypothetical protein